MPTYSNEFKDNIVRKMMPPNSQSVEQICKEVCLSRSTLYVLMQLAYLTHVLTDIAHYPVDKGSKLLPKNVKLFIRSQLSNIAKLNWHKHGADRMLTKAVQLHKIFYAPQTNE